MSEGFSGQLIPKTEMARLLPGIGSIAGPVQTIRSMSVFAQSSKDDFSLSYRPSLPDGLPI
jgi:hypothetical protein